MLRLFGLLGSSTHGNGRRRRRLGAFVAIVLALALAALAWTIFVPDFEIRLDPAMVLFGIAACIIAWSFYALVDRRSTSAGTVVVNYDFKLTQPSLPGGRYRSELIVFYELEVRGRLERQRQAVVELIFKKSEHPDIWAFSEREIGRFLKEHRKLAAQRFPEATILCAPPPRTRGGRRSAAASETSS